MAGPARILTTHTGSLQRPPRLRDMLVAKSKHEPVDTEALEAEIERAVRAVVKKQVDIGLDYINDGEQSKVGFAQYIRERLDGYDSEPIERVTNLEYRQFPHLYVKQMQVPCTSPLAWKDFAAVERDISRLKAATAGIKDKRIFMNAPSPGTLANNNPNRYYKSHEAYLEAIIETMRREYEAIADAGFYLQVDSPDLTQRSYNFPDSTMAEFRAVVRQNIEAFHEATKTIPRDKIRVHVCWGANEAPHNHDTELNELIDLLVQIRCSAMSVVGANGRHAHEWKIWKTVELPAHLKIIPGVIDSTTNIVEHPEAVAERILRYMEVLGPERIEAGVDCGFGTQATTSRVDPEVAMEKLAALVQGAKLAAARL